MTYNESELIIGNGSSWEIGSASKILEFDRSLFVHFQIPLAYF